MTTLPPNSPSEFEPQNPAGQQEAAAQPAAPAAAPVPPAAPAAPTAPAAPATAPVPPAAPQFQAPQPPPPAAPTAGAPAAAAVDPLSNVQINYWLSAFFTWLPALIFYVIEKDKGQSLAWRYHVANLNFSLLRTILWVAAAIISNIPYIGWLLGMVLWIASIVLFVFHIIAAAKVTESYRAGAAPAFVFNLPLVK